MQNSVVGVLCLLVVLMAQTAAAEKKPLLSRALRALLPSSCASMLSHSPSANIFVVQGGGPEGAPYPSRAILRFEEMAPHTHRIWFWYPFEFDGDQAVQKPGLPLSSHPFDGAVNFFFEDGEEASQQPHLASMVVQSPDDPDQLSFIYPLAHRDDRYGARVVERNKKGRVKVVMDDDPSKEPMELIPITEFISREQGEVIKRLRAEGPQVKGRVLFQARADPSDKNLGLIFSVETEQVADWVAWKGFFLNHPEYVQALAMPLAVSVKLDSGSLFPLDFDLQEGLSVGTFAFTITDAEIRGRAFDHLRALARAEEDQTPGEISQDRVIQLASDPNPLNLTMTLDRNSAMELLLLYGEWITNAHLR